MLQPMSILGLLIGIIQPLSTSASLVTIANAGKITQCLGIKGQTLVMTDCMNGIGAEWDLSARGANTWAPLHVVGYATGTADNQQQCVDKDLKIKSCENTNAKWGWNPNTLHLHLNLAGKRWCLGLIGIELLVDSCHVINRTAVDGQNGYGAPVEQTWVLFPTNRPQIRILDRLSFPLRTSGHHIIDSEGRTVKLAGVSWDFGFGFSPVKKVAQTIKYLGFNSVRLSYEISMHAYNINGSYPPMPYNEIIHANPEFSGLNALEIFDRCIDALTNEGLLVILSTTGDSRWCCNTTVGNTIWHDTDRNMQHWLNSLTFAAVRYRRNKRVIGIDILNEVRVNENGTVPWWGLEAKLPESFGIQFADWRVAAAQGAVAVWQGNEDALVMVGGSLFSTDFWHVSQRPLKFADDCLKTRIVYAPHEYHWLWPFNQWLNHLADTFAPLSFYHHLKRVIKSAKDEEMMEESGSSIIDSGFHHQEKEDSFISYESWAASRDRSVYYLMKDDVAPVWVSEFGTSQKVDNAYWSYVLHYYRKYDVNWCYWLLDPIRHLQNFKTRGLNRQTNETFGIFDSFKQDYSAVVGWRLQDLISIQSPSRSTPKRLSAPSKCTFHLDANLDAAKEPTSWIEFVSTMTWTTTSLFEALVFFSLVFFAPCCCCISCCLASRNTVRQNDARLWPLSKSEKAYLALNSSWLDCARNPLQGAFGTNAKQNKPGGSFIEAQSTKIQVDDTDVCVPSGGLVSMLCCNTRAPRRSLQSKVAPTAYSSGDQVGR